ncbi:hypothetical protein [Burkholderia arboris]|uniref:hypothetical protein n=1 Tax=Burkholderia arboris TaxID=488730 RepID=UPI001CF3A016|nr:hypothetical protein [Burkholderia arboris]MCA8051313.1 hypothetical protein [Burkholderia arboris]
MDKLEWIGDNIGLNPDNDVMVRLRDPVMPRGAWAVGLVDALSVADRLDAFGRQRIEAALPFAAEHGHLSFGDLAVWRDYEHYGVVRWIPVVRVRRDDGTEVSVTGDPLPGHAAALDVALGMQAQMSGEWYGVRRIG